MLSYLRPLRIVWSLSWLDEELWVSNSESVLFFIS
jgi:hypothetical protein